MRVELLRPGSDLPIVAAEHGMPLQADRIHIIPPGTMMGVRDG